VAIAAEEVTSRHIVMAGLAAFAKARSAKPTCGPAEPWRRRDPAIHVFFSRQRQKGVDARDIKREDALRALARA
jgi:hypothetical protein